MVILIFELLHHFRFKGGIQLKPITLAQDMEKASKMWIHQDSSSFPYVRRLVRYNPNVAAFKDDGTLVSWILR